MKGIVKLFTFQVFVNNVEVICRYACKMSDIDNILSMFQFKNCDIIITSEED